jgi:hypothetical protein
MSMKLNIRTTLLPLLFILTAAGPASFALDGHFDIARSSDVTDREPSSVMDLLPELSSLNCTPRCEGTVNCGKHKDIDSCLDDKTTKSGCFWSCE